MTTVVRTPEDLPDFIGVGESDNIPPHLVPALPEAPEKYLGVSSIKSVGHTETFRYATRLHFELRTDDGEERAATLTMPRDHLQITNKLLVRTGAWWTSKRGHNEHDDLHFAEAGMPTWYLAAPGEAAPGRAMRTIARAALHPAQTITHMRGIELDRTASIIHGSLDALPHFLPMFDLDTEEIGVEGDSHGAMSGLHVVAQASDHGREVATAQFVASCYLDRINNAEAIRTILSQLPAEFVAIGAVARHLSPELRRHYLNTISFHPLAIIGQAAMWPTLHSGKPRQAIERIPKDQHMGITTFKDDKSGQPELIEAAFQDYPNVKLRPRRGAHMSIPEPAVLEEITEALVEKLAA